MSDKYRMFKNFMYNDLGITKEDIKHWTEEAVKETSLKFVTDKMKDYDVNDLKIYIRSIIKREVESILREMIKGKVIENLVANVKIEVNTHDTK